MRDSEIRRLHIGDLERIARFRRAGYGGSVSDALWGLGVRDTVFSSQFKPLRQGMQLVGRALPMKLHALVEVGRSRGEQGERERGGGGGGGRSRELMRR